MKIILEAKNGSGELVLEGKEIKDEKLAREGLGDLVSVVSVKIGDSEILVDGGELSKASEALQPEQIEMM